jgi:hypothetical protein
MLDGRVLAVSMDVLVAFVRPVNISHFKLFRAVAVTHHIFINNINKEMAMSNPPRAFVRKGTDTTHPEQLFA